LHDPAEAERAQSRIVKGGGTADVRDSNASVVDHLRVLSLLTGLPLIVSGCLTIEGLDGVDVGGAVTEVFVGAKSRPLFFPPLLLQLLHDIRLAE